jgi:multicomponent Na+:H+ antiporter subunit A
MLIAVIVGFALAFVSPWLAGWFRGAAGWILSIYPFGVAAYLLSHVTGVAEETIPSESFSWAPSLALSLSFRLDGLGLLFSLLISGIGGLVVVYTGGYLGKHPLVGRFYAYLLAFMASMLGVVWSDNLILLFVFWELTSFTSYLLIGFDNEKPEARSAALQALLVTGAGGLVLLAGLLLLGAIGQSFEISELLGRRALIQEDPRTPWMLILILLGAFTKSAQFPFHFWLPNAMAAPTPASAYLHSSTMVKAGIYLLARFHVLFASTPIWLTLVTTVGAVTMISGAFLALRETYLKRLLAYTTVSVLGILTMLLGTGTSLAIKGALVFLVAHAFYKAALFLMAGAIDHETDERDVTRLGGLGRAMPCIAASGVLAGLSMAGVLPTLGFLAKEELFAASLEAAQSIVLTTASVVAGSWMVTVAVLVGAKPFWGTRVPTPRQPQNGPPSLWLGPLVLALLGLATGLFPNLLADALVGPAVTAVTQVSTEVHLQVWHGFTVPLLLDVVALAGGVGMFFVIGPVRRGIRSWDRILLRWGPGGAYEHGLWALNEVARYQTRFFQNGYLRYYLITIILTTVGLVGSLLAFSGGLPEGMVQLSDLRIHEVGVAVLILLAAATAIHAESRLAAIASLGVVGYAVGILYVMFGAPDLAITQFLIETLTVILFVLVFYRLRSYQRISSRVVRVRDVAISLSAGALMTMLVLLAGSAQWFPAISTYYDANSVRLAHGRNIVNVILVDFRGIDTLGEITVLSVAALGVFALLKLWPGRSEGSR